MCISPDCSMLACRTEGGGFDVCDLKAGQFLGEVDKGVEWLSPVVQESVVWRRVLVRLD